MNSVICSDMNNDELMDALNSPQGTLSGRNDLALALFGEIEYDAQDFLINDRVNAEIAFPGLPAEVSFTLWSCQDATGLLANSCSHPGGCDAHCRSNTGHDGG